MDIQKVKLLPLLKLAECEACSYAYKKKNKAGLFCGWEMGKGEGEKDERCVKVKECGSWPDFMY